jgi:hypothetical protein
MTLMVFSNVCQQGGQGMIVAQDGDVDKSKGIADLADELVTVVRAAACKGTSMHDVERDVLTRVLRLGHAALQEFVRLQGTGDLGETITLPDGQVLNRLPELHHRELMTVFGPLELERTAYGTREGQAIELLPLDSRLALPESKFSYVLQDLSQLLACEEPFAKVAQFLKRLLGLTLHVDSLERTNRAMAQEVESFRESQPVPPPKEEGTILVESADGKGVPIRRPADAPRIQDHQHKRGPKKDRKKMAIVGTVYTVDRHVRTPQEIVEALFRSPEEDATPHKRPRPCHKQVYASLTHENDNEDEARDGLATIMGWIAEQCRDRNPTGSKEIVCVMDGQESLWDARRFFQPDEPVTEVLDLLHVTQRLWQLAHLFHAPDSRQAEAFVREKLLRILQGELMSVIGGLRQMATKRGLGGRSRTELQKICRYFENNRDRMRYNEYLAKGYPIASGAIEGACRHYVKDRMERAGMSWIKPGAQAMLDLRSIHLNDQWDAYNLYRITQDTERLHPQRPLLQNVDWPLAV